MQRGSIKRCDFGLGGKGEQVKERRKIEKDDQTRLGSISSSILLSINSEKEGKL